MQADVGVKRRPVQLQHRRTIAFGQLRRRANESALTDSGLAAKGHVSLIYALRVPKDFKCDVLGVIMPYSMYRGGTGASSVSTYRLTGRGNPARPRVGLLP
jgi:hypothetical protein